MGLHTHTGRVHAYILAVVLCCGTACDNKHTVFVPGVYLLHTTVSDKNCVAKAWPYDKTEAAQFRFDTGKAVALKNWVQYV